MVGTGHLVINDWLSWTYHRRPPQSIKQCVRKDVMVMAMRFRVHDRSLLLRRRVMLGTWQVVEIKWECVAESYTSIQDLSEIIERKVVGQYKIKVQR